MKKKKLLITIVSVLFFGLLSAGAVLAGNKLKAYFFWGEGCPHCVKEKAFLEELVKKYPQLEIEDYEIYAHPEPLPAGR